MKFLIFWVLISAFIPRYALANYANDINAYEREIFLPFGDISLLSNFEQINNEWQSAKKKDDYANGWLFGSYCVTSVKKYKDSRDIKWLNLSEEIIKYYDEIYEKWKLFPNRQYQNFDENWVSSMDMPVIALCSEMLYEVTGEKIYRNYLNSLIGSMERTVDDGGFLIKINEGEYWLSEYADKKINIENEYYVLNGFFVGLQAILMLELKLNNPILKELYEKSFNHYDRIREKFWLGNGIWSLYMLNPKNIIPPHYKIFQKKQLEALELLTRNSYNQHNNVYRAELIKHVLALKSALTVHFYESKGNNSKKNSNDDYQYVMFRAPVHPYLIDIYQTYIEFFDVNGKIIKKAYAKTREHSFKERVFMSGSVSGAVDSYKVWAVYSSGEYCNILNAKASFVKPRVNYSAQPINGLITSLENLVPFQRSNKKHYKFGPSSELDANIYIELPINKRKLFNKINHSSFFGFEVQSSDKIYFQIYVYDSKGKGWVRSYTPLIKGKNFVLLSLLGFDDLTSDIKSVRIRLNRSIGDSASDFSFNKFLIFHDQYSLFNYIKNTEYLINEQF